MTRRAAVAALMTAAVARVDESWTFGIVGLCLTGPGAVTIRQVRLEDAKGIILERRAGGSHLQRQRPDVPRQVG